VPAVRSYRHDSELIPPLDHAVIYAAKAKGMLVGAGDNKGVFSMCDYSLHNVRSRPANVGDKLATHNFNTGTVGFAAPEDANMRSVFFRERSLPLLRK
jgi:hypothetical protein